MGNYLSAYVTYTEKYSEEELGIAKKVMRGLSSVGIIPTIIKTAHDLVSTETAVTELLFPIEVDNDRFRQNVEVAIRQACPSGSDLEIAFNVN